jgi:HD-GYP domain-containing protein (c-di-GMP phosphodiesterase class II)
VYRKAMARGEAIAEIERCSGTQFDPLCVQALLEIVRTGAGPREARDRLVRLPHEED